MSSSNLIRWAGLANILAGLFVALGSLLHPPEEAAAVSTSLWAIAHVLLLLSLIVGILGLMGLHARQTRETRALGVTGFIAIFVAMTSFLSIVYFEAFINPVLAAEAPTFVEKQMTGGLTGPLTVILPLTGLLFSLGWLLFGIATTRANVLPRPAAVLAIIGAVPFGLAAVLPLIVGKIAAVVFGAGLIWLGYALWVEKGAAMVRSVPAADG